MNQNNDPAIKHKLGLLELAHQAFFAEQEGVAFYGTLQPVSNLFRAMRKLKWLN